MKKTKPTITPFLLMFSISHSAAGQTALTTANMPRGGDVVKMEMLDIADAGNGGIGQVWDYSGTDVLEGSHCISYSGDSIMVGIEDGTIHL